MSITSDKTHPRVHTVMIHVNNEPVEVEGPKRTGLEIKEAAISQGVPDVELDFVLSKEMGQGRTNIVGDTDEVVVNKKSRFLLVAPDDNS